MILKNFLTFPGWMTVCFYHFFLYCFFLQERAFMPFCFPSPSLALPRSAEGSCSLPLCAGNSFYDQNVTCLERRSSAFLSLFRSFFSRCPPLSPSMADSAVSPPRAARPLLSVSSLFAFPFSFHPSLHFSSWFPLIFMHILSIFILCLTLSLLMSMIYD